FLSTGRRVLEEYEARLESTGDTFPGWRAFSERKKYKASERFRLRLRAPTAPDGETISVLINGKTVDLLSIRRGRGRIDREKPFGGGIPEVKAGDTLSIQYQGVEVMRGDYYRD